MAAKRQQQSSGLKDDLSTVVGLGISQFIVGILSIVCALVGFQLECYQYSLGITMCTGALFMTNGGVAYSLKSDMSKKLVRDSFRISVVCILVASMLIAYGGITAWTDFADDNDIQGGIDQAVMVIGLVELGLAINSTVVSSRLSTGLSKYDPLRTMTEYHTTKDRTILLVPMPEDDVPLIQLPDDYKVTKVFVTD